MGPGETAISGFDLEALSINVAGGGATSFDGKVKTLQLKMAGVGDILLKAPKGFVADTLEADIAGTGSLDAEAFPSARVGVAMAGTGDVSVHATKAVTVRGAGTGDLTVSGNPEEQFVNLWGNGKVTFKRALMRRA